MDIPSYLLGRRSGGSGGATIEVVTELPTTGESNVIYLVPKQDTGDNDVFDEYIYVNNDWELIGSTAIDLSEYQPLLTVGDGIDITNNVISSTMPIYLIENNNYSSPFVIKDCKLGIYTFGKSGTIYYKAYPLQASPSFFNMTDGFWIITNSDISSSSADAKQKIGYVYGTRQNTSTGVFETFVGELVVITAFGSVDIENISSIGAVPMTGNVTISGTKTFSTLPQSSVVPTSDNQLVNKKYVDDSITTALNGSY